MSNFHATAPPSAAMHLHGHSPAAVTTFQNQLDAHSLQLTDTMTLSTNQIVPGLKTFNNINLTTINGSAYPPTTIDCIDTIATTRMYPVMTNGLGIQPTEIMNSLNPFTIIPSSGEVAVRDQLFIQGAGGSRNVAMGTNAGSSIGTIIADTIAIGGNAGTNTQQRGSIAIGSRCGETFQGVNSIAIGVAAARLNQGANSIAIGTGAGLASQHRNSIILSANPTAVNSTANFTCYIAPIRGQALGLGVGVMHYNPISFEVTYSTT